MLNLGIVLIVQQLGVSCLIGKPGIENNNIICLPKKKIVVLAGGSSVHHTSYSQKNQNYVLARAVQAVTLQPNDSIAYCLPVPLNHHQYVAITPRPQSLKWLSPMMQEVRNGRICLVNNSDSIITIKKHDHLADLRSSVAFEMHNPPSIYAVPRPDNFQFKDFALSRPYSPDFLKQLKVDPDKILSTQQREMFNDLHRKFPHLFTTQPGKYNGYAGYVENRLQFASPPAPNSRTHIPCYSPSMNKLLAEKMDKLEEWGVLVSPEKVGVAVQFVSPSMLVPKPDSPDFRLVTDFAGLNVYLKRVPNTSGTISQAKARIAKAKYAVHLDLSNYFYQTGLQYDDIKYLGTVHPFKGLKVYTVDPQGLKGASERSYEKLLRIYGDMIQDGKLAQMADGLHVLADSIPDLLNYYEEVLTRADLCHLTFKPSKVIVCPKVVNLFGWILNDQTWLPTPHIISSLANASTPSTVKQLRSFLGSFKQLSSSLPKYAPTIHALERMVSGKQSAEKLKWTDELNASFVAAKQLAMNPVGLAEPRPDDLLQTYSDYSADNRAVGGRIVILRKQPNGETRELIGGFYSAVLSKHKRAWLPCEGEAAAIRLVLEHFRHFIRESNHTTVHFTDSQP